MDTSWPRGLCSPSRQDTGGGQGWNENDPGVAPATVSLIEPFAELLESSTQASVNRRYGNTLDLRDLTRTEFLEKALEDDVAVGLVEAENDREDFPLELSKLGKFCGIGRQILRLRRLPFTLTAASGRPLVVTMTSPEDSPEPPRRLPALSWGLSHGDKPGFLDKVIRIAFLSRKSDCESSEPARVLEELL